MKKLMKKTIINIIQSKKENNQAPATLNLEIDIKGKKVIKEIPLPPEYEPGDHVEVDIRTDITPNDDIDEIRLNVIKAPQNMKNNNKVITVTPQKVKTVKTDVPQVEEQEPIKTEKIEKQKTSEEIEDEIRQMEADIERLKAENERLKNNL